MVIVKQDGSLREVTRVHVNRLRGRKEDETPEEELETIWESMVVSRDGDEEDDMEVASGREQR